MPLLGMQDQEAMEERPLPNGEYGFSAVGMSQLGAAEYTLVTIVNDESGSVNGFTTDMERALGAIVQACKLSPRANNLLIRLVGFANRLREIHGYRLLDQCKPADYHGVLQSNGNTALYDAARNAVEAASAQAEQMHAAGYTVNAICFILTDGMENSSHCGLEHVTAAMKHAGRTPALDSLVSVLIGVNVQDPAVSTALQRFQSAAGFTRYVELAGADRATLAKLADFVSRSISMQSQALGSGAISQPLTF